MRLMKLKVKKVKIKFEEAASEGECEKPRVGESTQSRDPSVCLMQCERVCKRARIVDVSDQF